MDRCSTGTTRREGTSSSACRLCNRNMVLPNTSVWCLSLEVLCNPTTSLWHMEPEALKQGPNITARQQGPGKKLEGNEISLQSSPSSTPASGHQYKPDVFSQRPVWEDKLLSWLYHYLANIVTAVLPWNKENARVVKEKLLLCNFHHSIKCMWLFLHVQSGHHIKTPGCFAVTVNRVSLKTVGYEMLSPFTAPQEITTVWGRYFRKQLLLRQPVWERACQGVIYLSHTQRLPRGQTEIFSRPTATEAKWRMTEGREKCN